MLQVRTCVCVMCDINCNYTIIIPTVMLESSSNQTCPGDTVTYTCVTDTGQLVWRENNKAQTLFTIDYHPPQQLDIFTVNVTSISGLVIVSTATINNVLHHSGTILSCWDNAIRNLANMSNRTLTISGMVGSYKYGYTYIAMRKKVLFFMQVHHLHPSTSPSPPPPPSPLSPSAG